MLDGSIFDTMNQRSAEVKTDFLGLGVYPMKLVSVTQEISKKQNKVLKVVMDSGYKNDDNTSRFTNAYFNIEGTFLNKDRIEKPNIDLFVAFMKQCFGLDKFDQGVINKCIGQSLAVATKRDSEGYISYWYAGSIRNITNMQNGYKAKDESNGSRPERKTETGPAPTKPIDDNVIYDSNGNPVF